jgi:hypothetical protein
MSWLVKAGGQAAIDLKDVDRQIKAAQIDDVMRRVQNPGIAELSWICTTMNSAGKRELPWAPELRRLFALWQASGPNLKAMLDTNPEITSKIESDLRPLFVASVTGRGYVHVGVASGIALVDGDWKVANADAIARQGRGLFLLMTLNPFCERLGGPCPRCKKYFVRKTAKRSIYCSRQCASQSTALAATAKARQQQRTEKLKRAESAIAEWDRLKNKGRTKATWREWVSAYDPEITAQFLTRAMNAGELTPPEQPVSKAVK